ncbi:MAG TPA: hypothetical protein VFT55_12300 [Planctomycetota bacterium]|nr:hypothetical protein [Planctomycetota bacterium]
MDERMRWWVIPGALVVLLRVVTLEGTVGETWQPDDADDVEGVVVLRDATGSSGGKVAEAACIVSLPAEQIGLRGVMTVWRRLDGERERTPRLVLRSRVRSDATVPVAGLAKGRYDLEMVFGEGAGRHFAACNVEVPGAVTLRKAP